MPRPDIFEEHSSVLARWWALGRQPRTVIYLDAHLDLQPLDAQAMARLHQCQTTQDIAALERPHPLDPSPHPVYGLEDWLYPAHQLGLIGQLIWVVPPHVGTGFDTAALMQLCQTDGVTMADLASFRRAPGGWIEGTLLSLPMRICSLSQLARLDLPASCLIDIDTDYFVSLPEDATWISPPDVAAALHALPIKIEHVTISRSVGSGFMPDRYRYIADELATLFCGGAVDTARVQAEAQTRAEQGIHQAVDVTADILRDACAIRHRRLPIDLATLMAMQAQLNVQRDTRPVAAWCWAALGLLFVKFAKLDEAMACHRRSEALTGPHPELALAIGKALSRQSTDQAAMSQAITWLALALSTSKWRTAALAYMSHVHLAQGALQEALPLIEQAHARAPLWQDVLRLRIAILQSLGRHGQARAMQIEFNAVEQAVALAAQRLS